MAQPPRIPLKLDQQHQSKPKSIASHRKDNPQDSPSDGKNRSEISVNKFPRLSSLRQSIGVAAAATPTTTPTTKESAYIYKSDVLNCWYQPTSKVFLSKYRVELQALLDSIKDNYHNDFKALYESQLNSDLIIAIGDQFETRFHKCIIASRAFKFYGALRGFKLGLSNELDDASRLDDDITLLTKCKEKTKKEDKDLNQDREEKAAAAASESAEEDKILTEDKLIVEELHCRLPDDLINPEILLNFARRAYIDQDLTDEEAPLYKLLVDWLKINKPGLVRPSLNLSCSPHHRKSFRTIQPDFDRLSINSNNSSSIMSKKEQYSGEVGGGSKTRTSSIGTESNLDTGAIEYMENPQTLTNTRDESSTNSFTRTETFELLSRSNLDSSSSSAAPGNGRHAIDAAIDSTDDESRRKSEIGGDPNDDSETSESYAPTTRTGLKPKTFTKPVGIKSNKSKRPTTVIEKKLPVTANSGSGGGGGGGGSTAVGLVESIDDNSSGQQQFARSGSVNKKRTGNSNNRSTELDHQSLRQNDKTMQPANIKFSSTGAAAKSKTVGGGGGGGVTAKTNKLTVIARAQPISMERSQSPGIGGLVKVSGSTKNFIAANKRSVAQRDKTSRLAAAATQQSGSNGPDSSGDLSRDSETETSDTSFLPLDFVKTEHLPAQLDHFTLVTYSKLAEALSRMFIDGILIDSVVYVKDGKHFGAHKCILAARSPYLNEVINQQCLPSASSMDNNNSQQGQQQQQVVNNKALKIDLSEFSYPAVYFSILHIYSGIVKVPNDLELDELAKLSYLLHVSTLKQVSIQNLRMLYCHCFHKPCSICCMGVLKTLPLAWRYDYTELYSECLQWIGANFANIFCLEEFSKLKPHDLIEECYNATLSQLSPDNVIQKTVECQKLLKSLPRVKWTESIICLVGRQLEDFCHYVADNYDKVLQTDSFLNLGKSCWGCEILEENLLAAMNHLKPDIGCKTLIQLDTIECANEMNFGDESRTSVSGTFANLITKMRKYCERYLLKEAPLVVHCSSWRQMAPALQKRIKDQALLATDFDEPTKQLANKPKLLPNTIKGAAGGQYHHQRTSISPQLLKTGNTSGSESTKGSPSNPSTPDPKVSKSSPSPATTYLPSPKNKQPATRQVKVLK